MIRYKKYLFLTALCAICHGCGGIGFAYQKKLPGKYGLIACDTMPQMALCEIDPDGSGLTVVPQTVFAVGWNKHFIIAKRHPPTGMAINEIDKTKTEFYILDVTAEKLYGPFDEDKFNKQRESLGVPATLKFTLVFKDLS